MQNNGVRNFLTTEQYDALIEESTIGETMASVKNKGMYVSPCSPIFHSLTFGGKRDAERTRIAQKVRDRV